MCFLVGRLFRHHLLQCFDGRTYSPRSHKSWASSMSSERCSRRSSCAPTLCPLLVAVLGQELSRVQIDRRPVGGGISRAAGRSAASSKASTSAHISPSGHSTSGSLSEAEYREPATGSRALRVAWTIWRRFLKPDLLYGPQEVHRLFAMKAMMRCKGEQLHQGRRLPQTPLLGLYDPGANGNPQLAEQPDPYGLGLPANEALPTSFHVTNLA